MKRKLFALTFLLAASNSFGMENLNFTSVEALLKTLGNLTFSSPSLYPRKYDETFSKLPNCLDIFITAFRKYRDYSQFSTLLSLYKHQSFTGNNNTDAPLFNTIHRMIKIQTLNFLKSPQVESIDKTVVTNGLGIIWRIRQEHKKILKKNLPSSQPLNLTPKLKQFVSKKHAQLNEFQDCKLLIDSLGLYQKKPAE